MAISPVNRHDLCRVLFWQRVMGLCLFLLTCPVSACAGQVYYVDGLSGSDRANGRTKETAWKTTAGVNSTELQPGDTVSFAKGRIYSTNGDGLQLKGGVTYRSHGSGHLPIIEGGRLVTGWRPIGTMRVAVLSARRSERMEMIWEDQVAGVRKQSVDSVTAPGDFYFDGTSGALYYRPRNADKDPRIVFARHHERNSFIKGDDGTVIGLHFRHGGEFCVATDAAGPHHGWVFRSGSITHCRQNGFAVLGSDSGSSFTLHGLEVSFHGRTGISLFRSITNTTISGCYVHDNAVSGIEIGGFEGGAGDTVVAWNRVENNAESGIGISPGSAGVIVAEYNTVVNNGWKVYDRTGIWTAAPSIIRYNYSAFNGHSGLGHGIQLDIGTRDAEVYGNFSEGNRSSGISVFNAVANVRVEDNLVYSNSGWGGIDVRTNKGPAVRGLRIINNLLVNNGPDLESGQGWQLLRFGKKPTGVVIDQNAYSAPVGRDVAMWGRPFPTVKSFQQATGFERNKFDERKLLDAVTKTPGVTRRGVYGRILSQLRPGTVR